MSRFSGLRHKGRIVLIAFVILLVLLALQMYFVNLAANSKIEAKVVVTRGDIPQGTQIKEAHVSVVDMPIEHVPEDAVHTKAEVVGKYAKYDLHKSEVLYSDRLSLFETKAGYEIGEGMSFVTLTLSPEQANGWQVEKDQIVDVLYVPAAASFMKEDIFIPYKEIKRFEGVRIVDVLNEKLFSIGDKEYDLASPKYMILELPQKDVEFLTVVKDKGRTEIIVK